VPAQNKPTQDLLGGDLRVVYVRTEEGRCLDTDFSGARVGFFVAHQHPTHRNRIVAFGVPQTDFAEALDLFILPAIPGDGGLLPPTLGIEEPRVEIWLSVSFLGLGTAL